MYRMLNSFSFIKLLVGKPYRTQIVTSRQQTTLQRCATLLFHCFTIPNHNQLPWFDPCWWLWPQTSSVHNTRVPVTWNVWYYSYQAQRMNFRGTLLRLWNDKITKNTKNNRGSLCLCYFQPTCTATEKMSNPGTQCLFHSWGNPVSTIYHSVWH